MTLFLNSKIRNATGRSGVLWACRNENP